MVPRDIALSCSNYKYIFVLFEFFFYIQKTVGVSSHEHPNKKQIVIKLLVAKCHSLGVLQHSLHDNIFILFSLLPHKLESHTVHSYTIKAKIFVFSNFLGH